MRLVLRYILVLTIFGYVLGKPFGTFKSEDSHTRNKRQISGYLSKVNYESQLAATRQAARDLGLTLCNDEPQDGVECNGGEDTSCVKWPEICNGIQVCGLAEREQCLQDTLDKYGAVWYDLCNGDESSDFCRLKDHQPVLVRCGKDITLDTDQSPAIITSPNYSENYYNNVYCFWRVTAPQGDSIKVTFVDFATELNYDSVSIGRGHNYQTEDIDDLIISKLNGNTMPEPSEFLIDSNEIFVTFVADGYDNDRGFDIRVQTMNGDDDMEGFPEEEPEMNTDCGGIIVLGDGESMEIYSSNFPNQYEANSMCDWRITAPLGRQVGIEVNMMEIEPKSDMLLIGAGTDVGNEDTIVERLIGNRAPEKAIVVTDNEVWVRFTTDSSIQRTGFHLTLRDHLIIGCGGHFSVPAGGSVIIGSTYYPFRAYRVEEYCEWRFKAAGGRKLTVRFLDFSTEKGNDVVSAGFGNEPAQDWSNYVVVEHSGDSLPELDAFDAKKGSAWVSFRSDSYVVARGFKILVGDTKDFGSGNKSPKRRTHNLYRACGGTISREDAISHVMITSPSEAHIYQPLLECYWIIDLPFGGHVSIMFDTFQTEQNRDFITIGNGSDPSQKSSIVLDQYSGFKLPKKINDNFQSLWVKFQSDLMNNFRGWRLHILPNPSTECGGVVTVPEGGSISIATPGYPTFYDKLECRYTIISAVGNRILFTIAEFETAAGDELTVGEGCNPQQKIGVILNQQSVARPEINYQFMTRDSGAWMYFSTRSMRFLKGWMINLADSTVPTAMPAYDCEPYTYDLPTTPLTAPALKPTQPPVIEEDAEEEEADDNSMGIPNWYDDMWSVNEALPSTIEPQEEGSDEA